MCPMKLFKIISPENGKKYDILYTCIDTFQTGELNARVAQDGEFQAKMQLVSYTIAGSTVEIPFWESLTLFKNFFSTSRV